MNDTPPRYDSSANTRRGVVAVIAREGRFLVIRRSRHVVAPHASCLPGGAIEPGESEEEALVREIHEELGAAIRPRRRLWQSITPWDVSLAWWHGDLDPDAMITPNPAEVDAVSWLTPDEMGRLPGLLPSNLAFLNALKSGEIDLEN